MSHKLEYNEKQFRELWDKGLTNSEIRNIMGLTSDSAVMKIARLIGLKRTPQQIVLVRKREMELRYGEANPMKIPQFKEKLKNTMLEKYGVEHASSIEGYQERVKATLRERYGTDKISEIPGMREKKKRNSLQRWGTDCPQKNEAVKARARKTCEERYGGPASMCSEEIKEKTRKTCQQKYGADSVLRAGIPQQAMMEKYGTVHALSIPEFQEKRRQTMRERYGGNSVLDSSQLKDRVLVTLNKTYREIYGDTNIVITNRSQLQVPPDIYELLEDKSRLSQALQDASGLTTMLAEKLGISLNMLDSYVSRHGLWDAVDTGSSKEEEEVRALIESWGITTQKTRDLISPYELDIYCPDYKIGIEFNGNWWHSEPQKGEKYHAYKSLLADRRGVFLYHIFEYEWRVPEKREKIISHLRNLFGLNQQKIYARQCEVREVSTTEAKSFLDQNHLQGKDKSSVRVGLYYQDELVAIMTMAKPRFNNKFDWELSRFCGKANYNIVGGASKLFKEVLNRCSGKIISYSNNAKTKGKLYEQLGFKFLGFSRPSYVWCNGTQKVLSRYQCQMKNEKEVMTERGYFRIYDAGTKVWSYDNQKEM